MNRRGPAIVAARCASVAAGGALLLAAVAAPAALREAPPTAHTGGFGEPTCHVCHFQAPVNSGAGGLTLEGLPDTWEPGRDYEIAVRLEHAGMRLAGFQLAARFEDGSQAGDLEAAADDAAVRVIAFQGVRYAHQTWDGARPDATGGARWLLRWTAPDGGGRVLFHAAGNAANDDDSPLGDFVYAVERASSPPRPSKD